MGSRDLQRLDLRVLGFELRELLGFRKFLVVP